MVQGPALCVSIHDVAPATWDACERLAQAVRAVADIPLTWLVVPEYHRGGGDQGRMETGLERALARGDELALHGFTHLDTAPRGPGLGQRFLRGTYSHEGEFAALPAIEAARRIQCGLDWFAERGWPVRGFVPPAWLMGEGAWQAVRAFDFDYTTTFRYFHLLRGGPAAGRGGAGQVLSPSLVYAARNRIGRLASPLMADLLALALAQRPLIRLSLHPPDVRHPRLLRHAQATVERLLASRAALTKAGFARRLAAPGITSMAPSSRHASSAGPIHHSTRDRSGAVPRAY
ncbi:polysaccharide deacetylase family protein [Massilia sp. UMI-21]|nr:polysaccharide deacetylase family protein [Massilia sp. UMI-21]